MRRMAFVVSLLSLSPMVGADSLWSATWILRETTPGGHLTMTVEEVGTGWKLTYKIVGLDGAGTIFSTILTLDGRGFLHWSMASQQRATRWGSERSIVVTRSPL